MSDKCDDWDFSHPVERQRTHGEKCWAWGHHHYACALARIADLEGQNAYCETRLKLAHNGQDALRARVAELEAALRPIDVHYPVTEGMRDHDPIACSLRVSDLRRVHAALRGKEER